MILMVRNNDHNNASFIELTRKYQQSESKFKTLLQLKCKYLDIKLPDLLQEIVRQIEWNVLKN